MYNIKTLKAGNDVYTDLLFTHAFTGVDTDSRIFSVGKAFIFQEIISSCSVLRSCSQFFCTPCKYFASSWTFTVNHAKQDGQSKIIVHHYSHIESAGCKTIVSLFKGPVSDSLSSLLYNYLCKRVAAANAFITPEWLPNTDSAIKHHSRQTYLQVREWMGTSENLHPTKWGWNVQEGNYVLILMDNSPDPVILLSMIHYNCSTGWKTLTCGCKTYGLECCVVCGPC